VPEGVTRITAKTDYTVEKKEERDGVAESGTEKRRRRKKQIGGREFSEHLHLHASQVSY
jgi:hypothetical protein